MPTTMRDNPLLHCVVQKQHLAKKWNRKKKFCPTDISQKQKENIIHPVKDYRKFVICKPFAA